MKRKNLTHPTTKKDIEAMKGIWQAAFDSSDSKLFFDFFYNQELCLVSKSNDTIVSMGHLLPIGDLVSSINPPLPTAMIYAVATLPEHRKLGIGSAITASLIELAHNVGYPAAVLCPAQDSLFDFYYDKTSMKEWFYASEYKFVSPLITQSQVALSEICPDEYIHLREELLQSIPYIRFNLQATQYQKELCGLYGGGLYRVNTPFGDSCAIIERQSGDLICIKELVMPKSVANSSEHFELLQNIATEAIMMFPAGECIIRTPAIHNHSTIQNANISFTTRRFAMLSLPPKLQNIAKTATPQPWYGLAFD